MSRTYRLPDFTYSKNLHKTDCRMRRSSCIPAPRKTLFIAFCVRRTFEKKRRGNGSERQRNIFERQNLAAVSFRLSLLRWIIHMPAKRAEGGAKYMRIVAAACSEKTRLAVYCGCAILERKNGSGRELLLCRIETEMPKGVETKSLLLVPFPSRASTSTVFFKFCC